MNTQELEHYKQRLTEESAQLEAELQTVGRRNPDVPGDWEAQPKDTDSTSTEWDEKGDKAEEAEENQAILDGLEIRWRNVKRALGKIESGAYGVCEVCNEPIETERLEADPSARTCKAHLEEGEKLGK